MFFTTIATRSPVESKAPIAGLPPGLKDPSSRPDAASRIRTESSIIRASSTSRVGLKRAHVTPLITQTLTGTYVPEVLSPVFQLSTALSGNKTLIGGDYLLSIGGLLTDPDADAFAWTDGQDDGSLPATQAYATVGDIPTEWGRWSPAGDGTSGAFVLNGTVVPAPGVLALMGLAGATRRRRRH